MASLFKRAKDFAQSPKGKQLTEEVKEQASKPENRRKVKELGQRFMRSGASAVAGVVLAIAAAGRCQTVMMSARGRWAIQRCSTGRCTARSTRVG